MYRLFLTPLYNHTLHRTNKLTAYLFPPKISNNSSSSSIFYLAHDSHMTVDASAITFGRCWGNSGRLCCANVGPISGRWRKYLGKAAVNIYVPDIGPTSEQLRRDIGPTSGRHRADGGSCRAGRHRKVHFSASIVLRSSARVFYNLACA